MRDWIRKTIIYSVYALFIGAIIGVLEAGFGLGLLAISEFRSENVFITVPFLAIAGLLIVFVFAKIGGDSSRGMELVFDAWKKEDGKIPLRTIPLMIGATFASHLCGGSCGREGVAVIVGASAAHNASRIFESKKGAGWFFANDAKKVFLVVGIGAGFAGLFGTPFAAVAFAMEVLVAGELRYEAILPTIVGAYSSYSVSRLLGIRPDSFILFDAEDFVVGYDAPTMLKVLVCAVLFGLVGALFAFSLKKITEFFQKVMKNAYVRIAVIGVIVSAAMLLLGNRYMGTGSTLVNLVFKNGDVRAIDWILKLVLTVVTLAAGFKGGEVAPLFAIGATFGAFIGRAFGLPIELIAALGFTAVFGSGTGTMIAPVLIGGEIFGWRMMPLFILVCVVARVSNNWVTIYKGQRKAY